MAGGIIDALESLLAAGESRPRTFPALPHSTTQATNALLEGDVAKVGIIAAGRGLEGMQVKTQTKVKAVQLAPGRDFTPLHRYVELPSDGVDDDEIRRNIEELKKRRR